MKLDFMVDWIIQVQKTNLTEQFGYDVTLPLTLNHKTAHWLSDQHSDIKIFWLGYVITFDDIQKCQKVHFEQKNVV